MAKKTNQKNNNSDKELIELGSNMVAGLYSAFVANTFQSPEGLYLSQTGAPLIASALNIVISSFRQRPLSDREKYRTNTSMEYIVKNIRQKIEDGKEVRQDGFFILDETNRSNATEVAEGLLMVVQKEHEEKKLKYYGNLLSNLVFDQEFSREQANFLIKVSQQLTYRQLCLINIFANHENYSLREIDYKGKDKKA